MIPEICIVFHVSIKNRKQSLVLRQTNTRLKKISSNYETKENMSYFKQLADKKAKL